MEPLGASLGLTQPVGAVGQVPALPLVAHLVQHHRRVPEDAHVRQHPLVQFPRIPIDPDHANLLLDGRWLEVAQAIINAAADQENQVRIGQ